VKKFFIVFIYCFFISLPSRQQNAGNITNRDSLQRISIPDSVTNQKIQVDSNVIRIADSLAKRSMDSLKRKKIQLFQTTLKEHPYLPFDEMPVQSNFYVRDNAQQELLFYFLVGLLLYFACIKLFFSKYLDNLTALFFRVTMRHQQIREQLLQTPLPSLLLNILFVISTGFYLASLARYYIFTVFGNFWITFLYAVLFVAAIYLGKYIILKIAGWIFNIRSATDTYIFIVFLVNKMIGIFLLPIIILISFPNQFLLPVVIPLSYLILILLLCYRFFNSFRPIRSEIKLNRFHFFLYLCAFEIAPLLLIYKVLLAYVERSI
jgi:hypothetical protein